MYGVDSPAVRESNQGSGRRYAAEGVHRMSGTSTGTSTSPARTPTPALPDNLAVAYTVTEAGPDNADEAFELISSSSIAILGVVPVTRNEVATWLTTPEGSMSRYLFVRERRTGDVAQWWAGFRFPGGSDCQVWIRTHPYLPEDDDQALTRVGFRELLGWARAVFQDAPGPSGAEPHLYTGCIGGDERALRHIQAAGFTHERTYWDMEARLSAASDPDPVVGMTVEAAADPRTVHRVVMEAFAEHWGWQPLEFDDWMSVELSGAGCDPDLWYLAYLDGSAAATMMLSRRAEELGVLYVQTLGTLAPFRRRGLASALLRLAYDVAAANGLERIQLTVDSDNPDHAPRIYRRAGLEVLHGYNLCRRLLTADVPVAEGRGD